MFTDVCVYMHWIHNPCFFGLSARKAYKKCHPQPWAHLVPRACSAPRNGCRWHRAGNVQDEPRAARGARGKKVLKMKTKETNPMLLGARHRAKKPPQELSVVKVGTPWATNTVVLNYNPMYEWNQYPRVHTDTSETDWINRGGRTNLLYRTLNHSCGGE